MVCSLMMLSTVKENFPTVNQGTGDVGTDRAEDLPEK